MAKLGTEKNPVILRVKSEKRAEEVVDICEKHGLTYIIGIESDKPEDISDIDRALNSAKPLVKKVEIGRNDPCSCGSGKKYKKCCMGKIDSLNMNKMNDGKIKSVPSCGLCGCTNKLTKTPCCDQWICDDEDQYVLFSYARNSCYRNHTRFTLCGYHYAEDHTGDWMNCRQCRETLKTEMYVYYGTNDYNFQKLENPPKYEPTRCSKCNEVISLGEDGYMVEPKGRYICENCLDIELPDFTESIPRM